MFKVRVVPQPSLTPVASPNAIAVVPTPSTTTDSGSSGSRLSSASPIQALTVHALFGTYSPSKWDIWMLGITIVIGGQYFSWNAGLAAGLYSYLIAYFLIASAYITLCCCTSEITGALPFAGGAYGLSRCTLGFFPGYLIGCCEALEYIAYVATSVVSLAKMIVDVVPLFEGLEPVIALVFYISALCIHIRGDRIFWVFNMVIGSVSLLIVLLFIFGSLPFVSFTKNARNDEFEFVNGLAGFMKVLPLATWFFVGVESLSLAGDRVDSPKTIIPFAQIACVLTLFITGVSVFFITVSLPPGITTLSTELVPFNNCFELLFRISHTDATILSLPATYATAFGFMWCYGKLIASMANSRLLPPILAKISAANGSTYVSLGVGSLLSYLVSLIVYWNPRLEDLIFSICITSAFMSYSGQCVGYISLKRNYKNIKSSSFKSPFGIPGAVYSMSVWLLGIVAIVGFQGNGGVEILVFLGIVFLLTLYYFGYARKKQTFSDQENRVLLVAHVMKFNVNRGKKPHKKIQVRRSSSSIAPKSPCS